MVGRYAIQVIDDASLPLSNVVTVLLFGGSFQFLSKTYDIIIIIQAYKASLKIYIYHQRTFSNMPYIVIMRDVLMILSQPLINLPVTIGHQNINVKTLLM